MLRTKVIRAKTEVVDKATGRIQVVASDETEDRQGDIIRAAGWQLDQFLKHPVLLASHDYASLRSQIGEWEEMKRKGVQLIGTARYYVGEGNSEADWGFNLAAKGRAAFSVGFIPLEYTVREGGDEWYGPFEFTKQELLEVSHVSIPANPNALQLLARSVGLHPEIDALVKELLAEDPVVKAGRVMSQANLNKLHQMMDLMADIHDGVCDMGDDCPMEKAIKQQVARPPWLQVARPPWLCDKTPTLESQAASVTLATYSGVETIAALRAGIKEAIRS